jgi:Mn-dependent DtxR family transcriptional regulator
MSDPLEIAAKAVQLYAETHPRPPHVTQKQAATMLGFSEKTVSAMVKDGRLRLNDCGMVPITEIDRVLSVRKVA